MKNILSSLFLVFCFLMSSCREDADPDYAARYVGSYSASAEENFEPYNLSGARKDTSYANVFVSIFRNGQDKKKLSVTMILPNGKQLRRNLKVTAAKDSLYDYFSDSRCLCTATIVGKMKGKSLELSLYNHKYDLDTHLLDSYLTVKAFRY
ncbi:hypothetical protein [Rufibacter sp. XAAS-G3-1]|uniref:hypothetical protein n=1 Tax=Rufibacter sp. XAAS-G3-1 TaxID=2729134 RepID=UPI0015E7AD83|nr:hypothetical protein [Rufibacter sp. XAAS-G3-1]